MKISQKQLKERCKPNLHPLLKDNSYDIMSIQAIELLTPNRFDILAKYIYIKFRNLKIDSGFGEEIYLNHIRVFNSFVENDGSKKVGKKGFLESFNNLIESVDNNGFIQESIVPLCSNNTIIDGAHRLATAIYYNKSISCVNINNASSNYNYRFFREQGLDAVFLDAMATEYVHLKNNVYMLLLWPAANGNDVEFLDILNTYGSIVHQKDIYLTKEGGVKLVRQVYKNESWVGSKRDSFIGARNKASWCFANSKKALKVFLFESTKDLIKMKEEIRGLFKIEKHAVHINDTKEETLELAGLLFNENSINWLNHSALRTFSWHDRLLSHYGNWIRDLNMNNEYFCIDGSSVLAAYGIREARDLDFFYFGDNNISTGFKEIGCHNNEIEHYNISRDDIVFNPMNHFVLNNVKFVSIALIREMKLIRNESKDVRDVELIRQLLLNEKNMTPFLERIKQYTTVSYFKTRIKFILLKFRYFYTKLKTNF